MTMNLDSILEGSERSAGHILRTAAMVCTAGFFLAGCIPITPEEGDTAPTSFCARWDYDHWHRFDFGDGATVDDLLATVRELYDVDRDNISIEKDSYGQTRSVLWTDNNADYNASLTTGDRLTRIEVQWHSQPPTIAQLIDCLGPPAIHFEATSDKGAVSYWVGEAVLALYRGYVSPLYFQGVASPAMESTPQEEQLDHLLERLLVFILSEEAYEAPGPSACARLSLSRWQEFRFGEDFVHDVVATVIRLWDIDRDKIEGGGRRTGGFFPVTWWDNEEMVHHMAIFSPSGRLEEVGVGMVPGLTLAQIIDCLGPPDYFSAYRGPYFATTELELYYIDEGFSVNGFFNHRYPGREPLERISPEFGMNEFTVYPQTLEDIADSYREVDDDGNLELCILRMWPGSIEAIEIDGDIWSERPARCG